MKKVSNTIAFNPQLPTAESARAGAVPGESHPPADRILWIDGVGGFLLVERDEVTLGQAVAGHSVDIGILGDLSRQSAVLRRCQGDYFLQPLQPARVNDVPVDRPRLLHSGDTLQLGSRVRLAFHQPSPLSATARLDLLTLNRFRPSVDGVLLLSETCLLGPGPTCHIRCPSWTEDLLLLRQTGQWFFRSRQAVEVDGKLLREPIPMRAGMRLRGPNFSLSVE